MAASWNADFLVAVALGQVPGYRRVTALGNNPDMDTTAAEDVWPGGGLYSFPAAATAMEVVSNSASDAAAGTGARTVTINGLDSNYVEVTQVVTLNGVAAVAIPSPLLRVNGASVTSAGSVETNVGTVTVRDAGGGTARAIIPAGYGITRQAVYTVPAGHSLCVTSQLFCVNRQTGVGRFATFANMFRTPTGVSRMPLELSIGDEPPYRHEGFMPIVLREKTDYTLRCTTVSSDNTDVTAAFEAILKSNDVD